MFGLTKPSDNERGIIERFCNSSDKQIELYCRLSGTPYYSDEGLKHMAETREVARVRDQLVNMVENQEIPYLFRSFLARFDSDGILIECWGMTTICIWPDTFVFKIF